VLCGGVVVGVEFLLELASDCPRKQAARLAQKLELCSRSAALCAGRCTVPPVGYGNAKCVFLFFVIDVRVGVGTADLIYLLRT
jgi:hypothetical protein